jgi:hypothetical protein
MCWLDAAAAAAVMNNIYGFAKKCGAVLPC